METLEATEQQGLAQDVEKMTLNYWAAIYPGAFAYMHRVVPEEEYGTHFQPAERRVAELPVQQFAGQEALALASGL